MGNPVVQLSCETKQTGGLTIRHENCNTKHIVPSSPDFLRALKKVCFSQTKDIPFSCVSKNHG